MTKLLVWLLALVWSLALLVGIRRRPAKPRRVLRAKYSRDRKWREHTTQALEELMIEKQRLDFAVRTIARRCGCSNGAMIFRLDRLEKDDFGKLDRRSKPYRFTVDKAFAAAVAHSPAPLPFPAPNGRG